MTDPISDEKLDEILALIGDGSNDMFAGFVRATEVKLPLLRALVLELRRLRADRAGVVEDALRELHEAIKVKVRFNGDHHPILADAMRKAERALSPAPKVEGETP